MDYCHPCQRHLNGALSCSGCGASAEECRSHPDALSVRDHTAVDEREDVSGEEATRERPSGGHRARSQGRGRGGRAGQDDMPAGERDDAFEDAADGDAPAAGGRRARSRGRGRGARVGRRDRKAAAHRRRRRRVLMIGAGLLLAAGGLSLAELGMEAPPAEPRAVSVDDVSDASPTAAADDVEDAGDGSNDPADVDKNGKKPDKSASPSASESEKSEGEDDAEDADKPRDRSATDATASPAPSAQDPTSDPGDSDTPATEPTADDPTPEPSPTETCKQFLWWCS
ncbi:hypothetical protein [Streptomyces europaeiscabiei]|uniref:SCO2400 family protein n=1 Tax=Streptomyces europaeiscabiei TaxID=146819 RepID=UPI0038B670A5